MRMISPLVLLTVLRAELPELHYLGRHHVNASLAQFDWVGSGFSFRIVPTAGTTSVSADMDPGGTVRFVVYVDGVEVADFTAEKGRQEFALPANGTVTVVKATEPQPKSIPVSLFGLRVSGESQIVAAPPASRRFAVYGDSDSAAFGVDGTSSVSTTECLAHPTKYENFAHGWVSRIASQYSAEVQVQAVSGIGVAKNVFGHSGPVLPEIVKRTLQTC